MVASIVTRGFGNNPATSTLTKKIVTQGYGGEIAPTPPVPPIEIGGGGTKIGRQPQSVLYTVKACLVEVNDKMVHQEICGIKKRTVPPKTRDPMIRARLKNNSVARGRSGIFIKAKLLRRPKEDSDDGESA